MPQLNFEVLNLVATKVLVSLGMLIVALFLILIGWLLAKLLQLVVKVVLQVFKLDEALKLLRFNALLEKAEIKRLPSELLADLAYWFSIIIIILAVAGAFGLTFALDTLNGMLSYVLVVFSAAIVLGLAVFLGIFLSELIKFLLLNLGLAYAKTIARVVNYAVITFGSVIALGQFGFDLSWISTNISVVVGAVGLGAAIAFGLGCKDMASDFLFNLFKGK